MTDFDTLGPYRVEDKLGQGGMGTVYRGAHVKTGQRVAIKVLARQMSQESRFRRRFDAEIETLKNLNHPNIVRLIGYGEERGLLFYSMELVEGPSLLEHLRKVKRLEWDAVIGIGIDICAALKHAHDFGVIHRDLKPANLLMEPEGRLKLTDFGIAKLFGSNEQTAAGSVLGTADYMAPEQATGGAVTPRTDLYALGSLMYACLVGRPPFGGRNLTQVIHGLKHESPAPLDLVLPGVPLELAELVHELLEKDPDDRPPTALAVGKRLASMRVGLRRRGEATEIDLSGPTISELPPPSSGETTHPEGLPLEPLRSGPDQPTISGSDSDIPTGGGTSAPGTIASRHTAEALEIRKPAEEPGEAQQTSQRSRFEAVAEGDRRVASPADYEEPWDLWQWVSIAALVLLLLTVVGIALWMMRHPSSDELLAEIVAAEAAGNAQAARVATEDFLRLYPHDPAAEELREAAGISDIEQMARKLRSRAVRFGGTEMLDPPQQSWLQAIELREQTPEAAAARLQTWLNVFGHADAARGDGPADDTLLRLIELTQLEIARLESSGAAEPDPRAEELSQWLQWARTNLSGSEWEQFRQGLESLYGEEPWAAPVLKELED